MKVFSGLCARARVSYRSFSCAAPRLQKPAVPAAVDAESGRPMVTRTEGQPAKVPIKADLGYGLPAWNAELERLRVVPSLKSFYGGNPMHEENINKLNAVLRKHINLPTRVIDVRTQQQQKRFITFEEYKGRLQAGTRLKPMHHKELTALLQRLRLIEPQLMPQEVEDAILEFVHSGSVLAQRAQKLKQLDGFGRSLSHGRRKTSKARVYLAKGDGEVIVNGRAFMDYFPLDKQRARVNYPFVATAQEGQYNVFAEVVGGGIGGQCEAIMYGIAKGLVVHNPLFKSRLHAAGLMTRDTRKVERKKPGKLKARKMPAWVKR